MELLITNDDGSTTKFTEDMAIAAVKERDELRAGQDRAWTKVTEIRRKVFEFFNDGYEAGETELTMSVGDVNDLLKSIGADTLKQLYTVRGSINFVLTDVEAESDEEASDAVENYLNVEYNGEGSIDWDIDIDRVDEQ